MTGIDMRTRKPLMIGKPWMVMEHDSGDCRQVAAYWRWRSVCRERDRRNAGIPSRPAGTVYTIRRRRHSRTTTAAAMAAAATLLAATVVLLGLGFGLDVVALVLSVLAILISLCALAMVLAGSSR